MLLNSSTTVYFTFKNKLFQCNSHVHTLVLSGRAITVCFSHIKNVSSKHTVTSAHFVKSNYENQMCSSSRQNHPLLLVGTFHVSVGCPPLRAFEPFKYRWKYGKRLHNSIMAMYSNELDVRVSVPTYFTFVKAALSPSSGKS